MARQSQQIIARHRAPMPRPVRRIFKTRLRNRVSEHAMVAQRAPVNGRLLAVSAAIHKPKTAALVLVQVLDSKGLSGSTIRLPRG